MAKQKPQKSQKKPVAKATKPAPKTASKGVQASNRKVHELSALIADLNKEYGDGTIVCGGSPLPNVDFQTTGIPDLDAACGGGLARGRIIELFGVESSGKTTTCLTAVAACQQTFIEKKQRMGVCAYIDAEHAIDPEWAKNLGVNMDDLLFTQPESGEQAFRILNTLAKSGLVDLIVVDSVASLVPLEELEGEAGDTRIGGQARLMSQGLRITKGAVNKSGCIVVFVNQIRNKIGVMHGNPETTPGGLALKFYASTRIEMRYGERMKEGENVIAIKTRVRIPKNKVAPPFRSAEYTIGFGIESADGVRIFGVDRIESLFDSALRAGVIEQSGSWFSFRGERLGLGKDKSMAQLRGNPEWAGKVRARLMEVSRPKAEDIKPDDDEEFDERLEDVEIPATEAEDQEEAAAAAAGEATEEVDLTAPA